jgi:hypothetical protein
MGRARIGQVPAATDARPFYSWRMVMASLWVVLCQYAVTFGKQVFSLLRRGYQAEVEARANRAKLEVERFYRRYDLSSMHDDDRPIVR